MVAAVLDVATDLVLAPRFGNTGVWVAFLPIYLYRAALRERAYPSRTARKQRDETDRGTMTKHSKAEREKRAAQTERIQEIERAWQGSIPAPVAKEFAAQVRAAKDRGPWVRPPDMAPGTAPRPPRPGHEPKPKKDETTPRRRY